MNKYSIARIIGLITAVLLIAIIIHTAYTGVSPDSKYYPLPFHPLFFVLIQIIIFTTVAIYPFFSSGYVHIIGDNIVSKLVSDKMITRIAITEYVIMFVLYILFVVDIRGYVP